MMLMKICCSGHTLIYNVRKGLGERTTGRPLASREGSERLTGLVNWAVDRVER